MDRYHAGGRYQLHRGDCLEVMPFLPEACVDCIVADPPYSSGGQFRGDRLQSTGRAALATGRRFVGIELSAYHYRRALEALEALEAAGLAEAA